MMVAPMDAVQKRDVVARMIGQAQAEHTGVELDRLAHVTREHQDVCEAARVRASHRAAERRPTLTGAGGADRKPALFVRGRFRGDLDLDQVAVMVVEPNSVRVDARRRSSRLIPSACRRSENLSMSSSNAPNDM
jgi:hypothetical protein